MNVIIRDEAAHHNNNAFTWSGPRGVAGYTEARIVDVAVMPDGHLGSLTPSRCKSATKSDHVDTAYQVFETGCAPETVPWPLALPFCRRSVSNRVSRTVSIKLPGAYMSFSSSSLFP
jgi:hypothetical protein